LTITINIENAAEYQWIAKYLDELKSHPTVKVDIQNGNIEDNPNGNSWENKVDTFLEFADNMAITVDKIEIPNREERNAR